MPNENVLRGYACPECGHEKSFIISPVEIAVFATDDGIEPAKFCEWDWDFRTSWFTCTSCGHAAVACKFYTEPDLDVPDELKVQEREYSIWSEGYIATGNSAGAKYWGVGKGATFSDACINFFATQPADVQSYFNAERGTYWGCKLYPTETEARRSYG